MSKESYLIGVDCGGSHTVAIAYTLNGQVLKTVQKGPANMTVNVDLAITNIHDAVQQLLTEFAGRQCNRILLGIAGLGTYPNVQDLPAKLNLTSQNVTVLNDAQLAQIAKLHGQPGLLVLAGTGSIVMGTLAGKTIRIGGWGHLLGDEGSGYQLSQLAVRQVTLDQDQQKLSSFSQALLQQVGLTTTSELVRQFYRWDKSQVAKLAPFVLGQAATGDATAVQIVQQATKGLAQQIQQAVQLSDWPLTETVRLALSGSVIEKNHYYRETLLQQLTTIGLKFQVEPIDESQNNASAVLYYDTTE